MLGMLVLALHDLRLLLTHRRRRRRDERRGAARAPTPCSPPTCRRCGRTPGRRRPRRTCGRCCAGSADRGEPPRTPACTRVQDAYSLRCAPQVHGAARDTLDHAAAVAGRELAAAVDNPVVTVDGRVESNGNFHGAPVGYVLDFLAIAVADVASDERAAHRPVPRRGPQPRPAAVPRRRPRRRLRAHDRPVHGGRDRQPSSSGWRCRRASTRSRRRRCRRTTSRWAGPPPASCAARVDGLARVLADRAPHRGAGARPARPAAARPPRPAPCWPPSAPWACPAPAPTATSPPRSRRSRTPSAPALVAAAQSALAPPPTRTPHHRSAELHEASEQDAASVTLRTRGRRP